MVRRRPQLYVQFIMQRKRQLHWRQHLQQQLSNRWEVLQQWSVVRGGLLHMRTQFQPDVSHSQEQGRGMHFLHGVGLLHDQRRMFLVALLFRWQ